MNIDYLKKTQDIYSVTIEIQKIIEEQLASKSFDLQEAIGKVLYLKNPNSEQEKLSIFLRMSTTSFKNMIQKKYAGRGDWSIFTSDVIDYLNSNFENNDFELKMQLVKITVDIMFQHIGIFDYQLIVSSISNSIDTTQTEK